MSDNDGASVDDLTTRVHAEVVQVYRLSMDVPRGTTVDEIRDLVAVQVKDTEMHTGSIRAVPDHPYTLPTPDLSQGWPPPVIPGGAPCKVCGTKRDEWPHGA